MDADLTTDVIEPADLNRFVSGCVCMYCTVSMLYEWKDALSVLCLLLTDSTL